MAKIYFIATLLMFQGFVFCYGTCDFQTPVGIRNESVVADDKLTNSTHRDANSSAKFGRLQGAKAWCPNVNDTDPYLQIDLGQNYSICGVEAQGEPGASVFTAFKLNSSTDGVSFTYVQSAQVFNGSAANGSTADNHTLSPNITARYIRFIPVSSSICLRVEIYIIIIIITPDGTTIIIVQASQTATANMESQSSYATESGVATATYVGGAVTTTDAGGAATTTYVGGAVSTTDAGGAATTTYAGGAPSTTAVGGAATTTYAVGAPSTTAADGGGASVTPSATDGGAASVTPSATDGGAASVTPSATDGGAASVTPSATDGGAASVTPSATDGDAASVTPSATDGGAVSPTTTQTTPTSSSVVENKIAKVKAKANITANVNCSGDNLSTYNKTIKEDLKAALQGKGVSASVETENITCNSPLKGIFVMSIYSMPSGIIIQQVLVAELKAGKFRGLTSENTKITTVYDGVTMTYKPKSGECKKCCSAGGGPIKVEPVCTPTEKCQGVELIDKEDDQYCLGGKHYEEYCKDECDFGIQNSPSFAVILLLAVTTLIETIMVC